MKNSVRYRISLLLLLAMVIPVLYSAFSDLHRAWIRHEMLEKLEHENMHTISIPLKEVRWYKKNKEILHNNRMFDIKSWKVVNQIAIFHGLYDEEESALNKLVEEQGEESGKHQQSHQYQQLLSSWIITDNGSMDLSLPTLPSKIFTGFIHAILPEVFTGNTSPPPRQHVA